MDAMQKTKGRLRYKDLIIPKKPKNNGRIEFINEDLEP